MWPDMANNGNLMLTYNTRQKLLLCFACNYSSRHGCYGLSDGSVVAAVQTRASRDAQS